MKKKPSSSDDRFEALVDELASPRGFDAIVAVFRAGKDGRSFGSNGMVTLHGQVASRVGCVGE